MAGIAISVHTLEITLWLLGIGLSAYILSLLGATRSFIETLMTLKKFLSVERYLVTFYKSVLSILDTFLKKRFNARLRAGISNFINF